MKKNKLCKMCGKTKKISEFGSYVHNANGKRYSTSFCSPCMKAYRADRYKKTKEHHAAVCKKWNKENPEKKRRHSKDAKNKLKKIVFENYGSICSCCGEDRIEFLAIDHINGGGNEERKRLGVRGGYQFYLYLKRNNFPDGYRVLCHNCNMSFGHFGYCPHNSIPHQD